MTVRRRRRPWWAQAVGLGLLAWLALELPYVNWRRVAAPVAAEPLMLRKDAKGSGAYGAPRSGGRHHRGIDLAAPLGSPVFAIRSGRVLDVGTHRGLGRYVILQHRRGFSSLYAHLSDTSVEEGARVRQGQPIGTVGKTGNARHRLIQPHVHLEVAQGAERINPAAVGFAFAAEAATDGEQDARGGE